MMNAISWWHCDFNHGSIWRLRDDGVFAVCEVFDGDEKIGLIVLGESRLNAGDSLDVNGAKFKAGRYSRRLVITLRALAKQTGKKFIRMTSPRPIGRLHPDMQHVESTYLLKVPE